MTKKELISQLGPYADDAPVLLFLDGNTLDVVIDEFRTPDGALDVTSIQLHCPLTVS